MKMKLLSSLALLCSVFANAVFAYDEIAGGTDHPDVPRISGSVLVAHASVDFGEGAFLALGEDEKVTAQYAEGRSTKLIYVTPEGTTPLAALRNYQEAFADLGEVTEVYSCMRGDCVRRTGKDFIWKDSARFENNFDDLDTIYSSHLFHTNQVYWYAKVVSDTASYDVSFYASERADYSLNRTELGTGRTLTHIQIIGNTAFESDLEFVEASAIEEAIADKGFIALYGLFFDSGKDDLTATSAPTLAEIATVLDASPDLDVYVVGHTDSDGSVAGNEELSQRRAASVVSSLTRDYGIADDRLVAIGAGLAAPVATNQTEEGKALNRRVELVQR